MKNLTFGGVMIAVFMTVNLMFNVDISSIQTYVIILKTAIIAVCIRNFLPSKSYTVFLVACFFVCLFTLPIQHTIIYNVPCLIGGYVIGRKRKKHNVIRDYFPFFFINTLMIAYKYLLYIFLMNSNLFLAYKEGFSNIFSNVLGINISPTLLNYFFILSLLADSAFSSIVIYAFSVYFMKQIGKLLNNLP